MTLGHKALHTSQAASCLRLSLHAPRIHVWLNAKKAQVLSPHPLMHITDAKIELFQFN